MGWTVGAEVLHDGSRVSRGWPPDSLTLHQGLMSPGGTAVYPRQDPVGEGTLMLRIIRSVLLALLALACGLPAAAQTPGTDEAAETTAPVVLDGYTLFQVRGARSYRAERRAGEIADRIARIAADGRVSIDSLIVRETPVASLVVAEDRLLVGVLDADAEL